MQDSTETTKNKNSTIFLFFLIIILFILIVTKRIINKSEDSKVVDTQSDDKNPIELNANNLKKTNEQQKRKIALGYEDGGVDEDSLTSEVDVDRQLLTGEELEELNTFQIEVVSTLNITLRNFPNVYNNIGKNKPCETNIDKASNTERLRVINEKSKKRYFEIKTTSDHKNLFDAYEKLRKDLLKIVENFLLTTDKNFDIEMFKWYDLYLKISVNSKIYHFLKKKLKNVKTSE